MACPHLSAQFITRGSGHSAVEASAYRARAVLHDERTGETHDYTRAQSKCLFEGIYAPKDAPEWTQDRARLWNHVEAFEKHRRAELAQEVNIALPAELTLEQNRWLLQDWVKENVTRKGLIADVAIHAPDRRGDARNIHAHVMIVRRKLDGSEFVRTKERYDTFSEKQAAKEADLAAMRSSWERLANKHLQRHGHDSRIDMGRKQDGEATLHMGKEATRMERRGEASELGDRNREIEAENARRRAETANENRPGFTTTLDGIRQREAKRTRGRDAETIHALDDLARTDPIGTARHFGHRLGDRPKSPEEMRGEMAERMRGFAANPQPGPTRDRAAPDPGLSSSTTPEPQEATRGREHTARASQAQRPPPAQERAAWAANLRAMAAADAPQKARKEPQERPGLAYLRAALTAARERLASLSGRLEATFATFSGRMHERLNISSSGVQPETSSRTTNAELAAELREGTRQDTARKAAADQQAARDDDRKQADRQKGEEKRVRRSIWQEELRVAEIEEAADRLRRGLSRDDGNTKGPKL